ncbi:glycosyl transferase family 39 [Fibrella aestuarina BUZ 2]|uniref:Glycosyl transferase family 39 n=1 Tax=Fibrella aestuarina BUZ 2 TaxID=1166018 RepID=I0K6E5_9BACT|nr:glycosyltransferase family 39 protein [Fibrella aestuarina]CCG99698.1 glycosyl transferase family 39 [Fibrella aestuarina BUZ 2]
MFSKRLFFSLLGLVVAANFTALFLPIMEPDNGLYGTVAKEMFLTGDYVNLYSCGVEWLDKPRLPFVLNVLFMKLLGVTTAAYKLPALLCFCGSLFYTYRFARLNYSVLVAQVATLMFGTAYHVILSNTDVRAEPFLTLFIIGPAYHFMRAWQEKQTNAWPHIVAGSLLAACAMMTKGPVVPVVTVGAGLVIHALLTGQVRSLFELRWLVAIVLTFVFTAPELYCLYQQFDAHPEKVVYGQTGTSGLRFFFWDSQMGRFLNNGPLRGSGDPLLFTHTLLWAMLPWALPFYAAVGRAIAGLVRRQNPLPEYLSLGAGLTLFVLFSASRFQLPHYLNIVFPFYTILGAHYLTTRSPVVLRRWVIGQTVLGVVGTLFVTGIVLFYQPARLLEGLLWIGLFTVTTAALFWRYQTAERGPMGTMMGRMVGLMAMLGGVINLILYPSIMQYQAGMVAADFANEKPALQRKTYLYGVHTFGESSWSYEYYTKQPTQYLYQDSTLKQATQAGPVQVFTSAPYADSLAQHGFQVRRIATFPYYHVSQLSGTFLNPETRASTLRAYVLAEVK